MFDANEVTPGPGCFRPDGRIRSFTKIQEIGNVAEASTTMALKLTGA